MRLILLLLVVEVVVLVVVQVVVLLLGLGRKWWLACVLPGATVEPQVAPERVCERREVNLEDARGGHLLNVVKLREQHQGRRQTKAAC